MKIDGRRLLAVSASAATVAALEVLVVAGARRLRRSAGDWPFSDKAAARTTRWAHVLLTEALAALQTELMQRQLRATVAADRALAGRRDAGPSIPTQRGPRRHVVAPSGAERVATPSGAVVNRRPVDPGGTP
jgi:hypothetical protein